jgi:hypothetical protein
MKHAALSLGMLMGIVAMAPAAHAADDLIQRIKQRGTLRVCEMS